jgi:HAMP domain-containing protein
MEPGARAVLIAALAAVVLTWWLLRPVRQITLATHRLAAGDYTTRLNVASRDEILRTPLAVLSGELEAMPSSTSAIAGKVLSGSRVGKMHCARMSPGTVPSVHTHLVPPISTPA